ncbi:fasciclin-like arabinogalactan protein 9-like [Dorcoceras hygrometricum]|uniref:Fasciclin-like arabinogalactan protein 9-like n=1 Tax=Dorcoceras hygrometricum TaxID=472368 RepID=A0A2Z7BX40_9LAMI|nr:fasciclin-like arabinogalactan protein 9-like [Dorcoceras hygrometricum]
MAAPSASSLIALSLTTLLAALVLIPAAHAQSAPAPTAPEPLDIFAILKKAGGYDTFARLLNQTRVGFQINNQVNNSNEGLSVFAPTDNAFQNLPSGTLNNLSDQQKVSLLLYHVLPRYYTLENLQTISNPVRTQATGQDGGVFVLNFTGQGNQLNVSTGVVQVTIYNTVRKDPPLAVYQVDKVLIPVDFTQPRPPTASPPANPGAPAAAGNGTSPGAPATPDNGNGAVKKGLGLGLVSGISFLCMWVLI